MLFSLVFNTTRKLLCNKNEMDLPVLPLHRYPEYTAECCQLINNEWKRSTTARMRGLECSCDTLPTCLILLKDNRVVGHCKLSPIPGIPTACFVESVVIDRKLRGQGYGTYLMAKAEEYCRSLLNLQVIYLSTKGQELFYSKLGYDKCQPISIYGSCTTASLSHISNGATKAENNGPIPPPMPTATPHPMESQKVYMNKIL